MSDTLSVIYLARHLPSGQITEFVPWTTDIWQDDVGQGFWPGTRIISFELGATPGLKEFGSTEAHGLALASLSCGRMIGKVKEEGSERSPSVFGGLQQLNELTYRRKTLCQSSTGTTNNKTRQ
jgi:hypothetical protein